MPITSAGARPSTRGINAFARATAVGEALNDSLTYRPIASSRDASGTTSCTSPIALARAASNRLPVRNSSRAAEAPIFCSTYGEIIAGRIPSLVSVKPKIAASSATTMSHTAASPEPPPSAAP